MVSLNGLDLIAPSALAPKTLHGSVPLSTRTTCSHGKNAQTKAVAIVKQEHVFASLVMMESLVKDQSARTIAMSVELAGLKSISLRKQDAFTRFHGTP